jgi:hypothetical protein
VKEFIRLVEDAKPGLIAPGIPGYGFHYKVTSDEKHNSSLSVRQVLHKFKKRAELRDRYFD